MLNIPIGRTTPMLRSKGERSQSFSANDPAQQPPQKKVLRHHQVSIPTTTLQPALLSQVAVAFHDRVTVGTKTKDSIEYKDAFEGKEAVVCICNIKEHLRTACLTLYIAARTNYALCSRQKTAIWHSLLAVHSMLKNSFTTWTMSIDFATLQTSSISLGNSWTIVNNPTLQIKRKMTERMANPLWFSWDAPIARMNISLTVFSHSWPTVTLQHAPEKTCVTASFVHVGWSR